MEPIQLTDPRIVQYFKDNDFIDVKKFVEKQVLDGIEKGKQNGVMEEKSETTIDYHKLHKEFSIFITQQKNIVNFMKENVKMVEKLRLEYLDEIVSEKFNIVKESHVCDVCARGFRNLKALATHQRSCIASEQQKGSEEEEKEE